jgi:hypothetical protein
MLKRPLEDYLGYEQDYPGFIEMVIRYENAVLPVCAECGSADTAKVGGGTVSRAIHLASATTKFKLRPNAPGRYFCNTCEAYFSPEDCARPIWWDELTGADEAD